MLLLDLQPAIAVVLVTALPRLTLLPIKAMLPLLMAARPPSVPLPPSACTLANSPSCRDSPLRMALLVLLRLPLPAALAPFKLPPRLGSPATQAPGLAPAAVAPAAAAAAASALSALNLGAGAYPNGDRGTCCCFSRCLLMTGERGGRPRVRDVTSSSSSSLTSALLLRDLESPTVMLRLAGGGSASDVGEWEPS